MMGCKEYFDSIVVFSILQGSARWLETLVLSEKENPSTFLVIGVLFMFELELEPACGVVFSYAQGVLI